MPIGLDRGDFGGSRRPPADLRQAATLPRPVAGWMQTAIATARSAAAIVVSAATQARALEPVIWTRWVTSGDERVCPVCGPYAGAVWRAGEGPLPPLHPNCRCRREYAFTTWIRGARD